ncbi:hypothetical protein ACH5RR_007218 [Cinchona calisaya]|uniref:Glucan endo-1,3-beta-D-glucosidase n=1 Tax=Cinchona calisaya TaxID=153742 RepID=A0ABD3ARM9_9GENT
MRNIFNAISAAGLGNRIKVSTAVETGLVGQSYPPSAGIFRQEVRSFINPIVQFLARTVPFTCTRIFLMLSWMQNIRHLKKQETRLFEIVVSESGWPSAGGQETSIDNARTYNNNLIRHVAGGSGTPKRPQRAIETYIFALFDEDQKKRAIETYIFALFDEDQKNPEYEKHFGLFLPNIPDQLLIDY